MQKSVKLALLPTLAYLLLLPLLLSLGFWQLNRANEKRELLAEQQRNKTADTIQLNATTPINLELLRYRRVSVNGHYDSSQQFLLDNQIHNGKAGYFVFTPFVLENSTSAVLINRGWLPLLATRNQLPNVAFTSTQTTIAGTINLFPRMGLELTGGDIPTKTTPSVIQRVNAKLLAQQLGYNLLPFQIELETTQPDGFRRDWQITPSMPPERHTGYALQWFALAATLTFLFFWYSFKKRS